MHPADIKAAIAKAGLTQTQIAALAVRAEGHVHKSAVSRVIAGELKSAGIARVISEAIRIPVSRLWPGKYPRLEFLEATGLVAKPTAPAAAKAAKPGARRAPRKPATKRAVAA